jgi:hypothetical protein
MSTRREKETEVSRMLSRRLVALLAVGLVVVLTGAACGGASDGAGAPFDEAAGNLAVTSAMMVWVPANAGAMANEIGMWVTLDAPVASDVAAKAVIEGISGGIGITVAKIASARGNDSYTATVGVTFPITMTLPIANPLLGTATSGEQGYTVTVSFDVTVSGGQVTEASEAYDVDAAKIED